MPNEDSDNMKLLKRHTAMLREHFDSVQIFVTKRLEEGATASVRWGDDYYARYGNVRAWLVQEDGVHAKCEDED